MSALETNLDGAGAGHVTESVLESTVHGMSSLAMARAKGVAENPSADVDVLLRLVHSGEHTLCFSAIYREGLPEPIYDAVVNYPDPRIRAILADCWDAPARQRARLAFDPDDEVRLMVATGPHPFRMAVEPLPDGIYAQLAKDPDVRVRRRLADVRLLPEAVRRQLLTDDQPKVRLTALREWPTRPPDDVVDMLLADSDPDVAGYARLCRPQTAPTELLAGLAEDLDMNSWADQSRLYDLKVAARVVPLTHDLAVALMEDGRLKEAVVENATLAPELVARLAVDPQPYIRLAVSMRPELTEDQRAAIDYDVRPEDRLTMPHWVFRRLDDLALMTTCARSAHVGMRRVAAYSPHLTPELVATLAEDTDFAVRLLLCENHPSAPADLLLRTFLEATVITRGALLYKPNFPRSGLARGVTSDDPQWRRLALFDPDTTPGQVEQLSHDQERSVRLAAARDRRLPAARVRELLAEPATAEPAASNPLIPVNLMHEILDQAGIPPVHQARVR